MTRRILRLLTIWLWPTIARWRAWRLRREARRVYAAMAGCDGPERDAVRALAGIPGKVVAPISPPRAGVGGGFPWSAMQPKVGGAMTGTLTLSAPGPTGGQTDRATHEIVDYARAITKTGDADR